MGQGTCNKRTNDKSVVLSLRNEKKKKNIRHVNERDDLLTNNNNNNNNMFVLTRHDGL